MGLSSFLAAIAALYMSMSVCRSVGQCTTSFKVHRKVIYNINISQLRLIIKEEQSKNDDYHFLFDSDEIFVLQCLTTGCLKKCKALYKIYTQLIHREVISPHQPKFINCGA